MAIVRWALTWAMYGCGDLVSRPMQSLDWGWLYPAYSWLMRSAHVVQGDGRGPWGPVLSEEETQAYIDSLPE